MLPLIIKPAMAALSAPLIDEAVKALELAIKDVKLTPEELKDLPL